MVFRNWVNVRWQKRCRESPAMELGLIDRLLTPGDILKTRLFVSRVELPRRWSEYYWQEVETPALGVNRRHGLIYAV
jgi:hypothetical protein